MSIERIELRKKYYDGNMVREAVMSVTNDYNTIMKLLKAFADQPPLTDVIEVVRCRDCRWHEREQPGMVYCPNTVGNWVEDDWYCADGEKRDVENS